MTQPPRIGPGLGAAVVLSGLLLVLLLLPLAALVLSTSLAELQNGFAHALFWPALSLSLGTSLQSLSITVLTGTPLAFWLATSRARTTRAVALLVELPIVIPPAVMGVALLQTFGRRGLLGPALSQAGVQLGFSEGAVILSQVVVSAPFYVQAAANAFRKVDLDMLTVARTLGASPSVALLRIAVPIALPGLVVGASLSWARALGEFGATLLFAGNMPGITQTMPLAIFTALETDVRLAVVFALVLAAMGAGLLLCLRAASGLLGARLGAANKPEAARLPEAA